MNNDDKDSSSDIDDDNDDDNEDDCSDVVKHEYPLYFISNVWMGEWILFSCEPRTATQTHYLTFIFYGHEWQINFL